jgi:nitrogen regulatory protein P-II 2
MHMIEAVIKPNRLDSVKTALVEKGLLGATALECKGFGKQRGHSERYRGPKLDAGFVPKVLLKVCVKPEDKDLAVKTILTAARTGNGEIGDGKIFVYPIAEVIRVRSGESGPAAV